MKSKSLLLLLAVAISMFSCKKDTLVEVVDVPASPIVAVEQKGGKPSDVQAIEGAFSLFELPYDYKGLEPHLDATTLELHYSKHYLGYVNALNKAVIKTKYEVLELPQVLKNLNLSDAEVRNNAGAVYNHNFYWETMASKAGGEPSGELMEAIQKDFGNFDEFRRQFVESSVRIVGSGWTWLISDKYGRLRIVTSNNNDNPLMKNLGISGIPLLNLDMWEHAYYLKFQTRKREYANTYFSLINWEVVQKRYEAFAKVAGGVAPIEISTPTEGTTTTTEPTTTENIKPTENQP